jgi:hypothetical protein
MNETHDYPFPGEEPVTVILHRDNWIVDEPCTSAIQLRALKRRKVRNKNLWRHRMEVVKD